MKQADWPPAGMVSNAEIAAVMREIGDLLELQGANPFRIRAYRMLALTLDTLVPSVQQMLAAGDNLERLPGVGPDLAGKMAEVVASGSCAQLDELHRAFPPGLPQLLDIPGLGPRKVAALYREGGIASTAMLAAALRDGRLARLRGFGGHCAERLQARWPPIRARRDGLPGHWPQHWPRPCWIGCAPARPMAWWSWPAATAAARKRWATSISWPTLAMPPR